MPFGFFFASLNIMSIHVSFFSITYGVTLHFNEVPKPMANNMHSRYVS